MADAILDPGMGTVSDFEKGELADRGVGDEGLVAPPAAFLEQRQLGTGVRSFAAHDDLHPGRPLRRAQQAGGQDLNSKLHTYIEGRNNRAHPFVWTKTADEILKKASRPTTSNPRH